MQKTNELKISFGLTRFISSIAFIIITLFFNGFLTLMEYEFDWTKITSIGFWIIYSINILSAILIFIIVYFLKKHSNIRHNRVVDRVKKIFKFSDDIYENNFIKQSEDWLKEVYNEHLRLDKYERLIKKQIRKINIKENDKKKTEKEIKRDLLLGYLENIETLRGNIEKELKNEPITEIKDNVFLAGLKQIKIREVDLNTLIANEFGYENEKHATPFTNEKMSLFINIVWGLFFGVIITILFFSFKDIVGKEITDEDRLILMVKCATFIGYAIRGIFTADSFVFGKYVNTLETRLKILNQMAFDIGLPYTEEIEEKIEVQDEKTVN